MSPHPAKANIAWSRISLIWLLLVGATALSWMAGHGALHDRRLAVTAVIGVAFIKVRLVILDFMEIRGAPLAVRLVGEAWVLLVCVSLIALYLLPRAA